MSCARLKIKGINDDAGANRQTKKGGFNNELKAP
jgi:hypothetical protein